MFSNLICNLGIIVINSRPTYFNSRGSLFFLTSEMCSFPTTWHQTAEFDFFQAQFIFDDKYQLRFSFDNLYEEFLQKVHFWGTKKTGVHLTGLTKKGVKALTIQIEL